MTMESHLRKEQRKSLASRRNLEWLHLELSKINAGVQFAPGEGINGTWGVPRYGIGEEVHDLTEAYATEYKQGNNSVFNYPNEEPVIDMQFPATGGKPEPLLKPFICNVSAPKSSDNHPGEGFCSSASEISNGKGFGTDAPQNPGDEENSEEASLMASFVQEFPIMRIKVARESDEQPVFSLPKVKVESVRRQTNESKQS
ncbi:unnamed protein product [Sphenostylis stenocarpa]|uniref:Uncharacterized protein n=1 Tax=Sphenostylis stenocarpa TaxID=92480 RepID=A0AA86SXX7_9FABA|nr:unnamed protein product [Sphenostylis stenocarpa]